MERNHILIVIAIIVIIGALFGISFYISDRGGEIPNGGFAIEEPTDVDIDTPLETITAKHQFKNGTHIVAGEIGVPTPCHILEWSVQIVEADIVGKGVVDESVIINLISSTQAEACAQVITPARFKVEVNASENARISMTLNGRPVILNLIEADPDENLGEFELFIKG